MRPGWSRRTFAMAFSPCLEKSLSNAQITASLSLLREPRSRPVGFPDSPGCQRLLGMCLCSHRVVVKQQYGSIEDSANCWRLTLEHGQRLQEGALTLLRCENGTVHL